MATSGFVKWQQLLVSSWFWKRHQLKWNVAQSVLLRIWKPVVVGCVVGEGAQSIHWISTAHSLKPANIFWEGCMCPPHTHTLFTRMIREYVHSAHTVKQKARSWQSHVLLGSFSEGIFGNLRDLWIVADYQPCSTVQANAPLNFIFFFEDSRVVF